MNYIKQLYWIILVLGCFSTESAAAELAEQSLVEVLHTIQDDYEVVFSYNYKDVKHITVQFKSDTQEKFETAINRALKGTGLKYKSVGLNFYIIYKDNNVNQRKLRRINRKIKEIRKIGNDDEFLISEKRSFSKASSSGKSKTIKGIILSEAGEPLVGASVVVTGTSTGTASEHDGSFELKVPVNTNRLSVSYTGFFTQNISIGGRSKVDIRLKEGLQLQGVTVFGSRGAPRTRFDSPIPIDHISAKALSITGKNFLDEQLSQIVPSFNSGQHPVSDASAHFNPVDLRGLLPSRTLVLVNGKRKNASALLYSYVTASRGEVGVDLKSVGTDAVDAVEVLRDGAAAQYGSDAIAGVLNLELKERIKPFVKVGYGTTSLLDGTQYQVSSGFSFDIHEKGYATFTLGYRQQDRSQRAGIITSAEDEAAHWGTTVFTTADFRDYLENNPRAGFQVGVPDIQSFNSSFNLGYTLNAETNTKLYAFGTLMSRSGRSPQFARGPYWVSGFEAIYPGEDFFLPEMAPEIGDHMITAGLNHKWNNWNVDLSSTFGSSQIEYFIKNSFNQSLGSSSPKDFYNGAHRFRHFVNNLDINKVFLPRSIKQVTLAFGVEQRFESFKGFAGEFASYGDGTPDVLDRIGSESFSGLSPTDAVFGTRNNIGFYTEVTSDLNDKVQLGAATRFERYSDFGGNLSWKVNGLYKAIPQKLNLRMAISNGFRAPSLHQIHFTSTTTTLTSEGVVQNRILNNLDPALSILKIPNLKPETSLNLGAGFTYRLSDKICFSFDAYQINLKDRVVLSGQIGQQEQASSPINQLLDYTRTGSAGFFLNAVNTSTQGIDLVLNIRDWKVGKGIMGGSIAANFNKTEVTNIHLPSFIEGNRLRDEVFSREDVSRLETWRPRQKVMLSLDYEISKFSTTIGINHFGAVTYHHPKNPADDAVYGGKVITNWSLQYNLSSQIQWQIGVNNLYNVYPDSFEESYNGTPNDRNIDFVGRFQYPWQTLQIGIDGIRGFTTLTFTL